MKDYFLVNVTLFPGFAMSTSMYSRLDLTMDTHSIDITPHGDWDRTVFELAQQVPPLSLGVGYSLGGRIALGIALKNPHLFSGLVLISSHAGLLDTEKHARIEQDDQLAKHALIDQRVMFETFDNNELFDANDTAFISSIRLDDSETIARQLRQLGLGAMPHLESQLINLPIPVMYITGSRDKKYRNLASRYKEKTAYAYHFQIDSDHRVPMTAPRILSLYIEWFAQQLQ